MKPIIGVTTAWSRETMLDERIIDDFFYAGDDYVSAIFRSNGIPFLLTPLAVEFSLQETVERILDNLNGLILSGGGGVGIKSRRYQHTLYEQQKKRYRFEKMLLQAAWMRDIPVLGICRGHQMIAEVLGGSITKQPFGNHSPGNGRDRHVISIQSESRFGQICGNDAWNVNSYHVQAIEKMPDGFEVSAFSDDVIIEAIEAKEKRFFIGTQFHPEKMISKDGRAKRLFKEFIKQASEYAQLG